MNELRQVSGTPDATDSPVGWASGTGGGRGQRSHDVERRILVQNVDQHHAHLHLPEPPGEPSQIAEVAVELPPLLEIEVPPLVPAVAVVGEGAGSAVGGLGVERGQSAAWGESAEAADTRRQPGAGPPPRCQHPAAGAGG